MTLDSTKNSTKPAPVYSTLGSDPDLGELVDMFVEEMPQRVQKLVDLCEDANWDDLRRTAHQLKGAAGSYGFLEISPLAAVLEDKIRDGQGEEEILQAVETLRAMCLAARAGVPE